MKNDRMAQRIANCQRRVIAELNDRWRVTDDGQLQWILEVRKGRERSKATGWRGRSFHTTRTHLLADIERLCGSAESNAMDALAELPTKYCVGGLHE
jgi:hypothetical protein